MKITPTITKEIDTNSKINFDVLGQGYELKECVNGTVPIQNTIFNVLYDKIYLYFLFGVRDNEISPSRTTYNSKLYNEEVVEVFVSGENRMRYVELEVSPNNTQFCGLVRNSDSGKRKLKLIGKSIFTSGVQATDWGYNTIIKVRKRAIEGVLGINKLKICYINAFRIDRPSKSEWELSALNPTGVANFHIPSAFVELEIKE